MARKAEPNQGGCGGYEDQHSGGGRTIFSSIVGLVNSSGFAGKDLRALFISGCSGAHLHLPVEWSIPNNEGHFVTRMGDIYGDGKTAARWMAAVFAGAQGVGSIPMQAAKIGASSVLHLLKHSGPAF